MPNGQQSVTVPSLAMAAPGDDMTMMTFPIPIALAVAVFLTIWFTLLFAVLPLGVKSQVESGEVVPGTDPGAPVAPRLLMKVGLTTLLSIAAFVILVMVLRVLG